MLKSIKHFISPTHDDKCGFKQDKTRLKHQCVWTLAPSSGKNLPSILAVGGITTTNVSQKFVVVNTAF